MSNIGSVDWGNYVHGRGRCLWCCLMERAKEERGKKERDGVDVLWWRGEGRKRWRINLGVWYYIISCCLPNHSFCYSSFLSLFPSPERLFIPTGLSLTSQERSYWRSRGNGRARYAVCSPLDLSLF